MRKKTFLLIIASATVTLSSLSFYASRPFCSSTFEQIEALTDDTGEIDPAIITCDSGGWGYCYKKHHETPPGHIFTDYSCVWTGYQSDKCPWWYLL